MAFITIFDMPRFNTKLGAIHVMRIIGWPLFVYHFLCTNRLIVPRYPHCELDEQKKCPPCLMYSLTASQNSVRKKNKD